jgi:hypothetical protein
VAYALTDASNTIEFRHLEAAWAMWSYCRASAAYIFGGILGNERADRLLKALGDAGPDGLDGTEQRDVFNRHASGEELEATRQYLHRHDLIVTRNDVPSGRGGRPGLRSWAKGREPNG